MDIRLKNVLAQDDTTIDTLYHAVDQCPVPMAGSPERSLAELPSTAQGAVAQNLPLIDVAMLSTMAKAFAHLPHTGVAELDCSTHQFPVSKLPECCNLRRLIVPSLSLVADLAGFPLPSLTELCVCLNSTPSHKDVALLNSITEKQGPQCKVYLQLPSNYNFGALETECVNGLVQLDMVHNVQTKKQQPQMLKELTLVVTKMQPADCKIGVLESHLPWVRICKYMPKLNLNKVHFTYDDDALVNEPPPAWLGQLEQADIIMPASSTQEQMATILSHLTSVKELTLRCPQPSLPKEGQVWASLRNLHTLNLLTETPAAASAAHSNPAAQLQALGSATQLRSLSWQGACHPQDLAPLGALINLDYLRLSTHRPAAGCSEGGADSVGSCGPRGEQCAWLRGLGALQQLYWKGMPTLPLPSLPASLQLCCLEHAAPAIAAAQMAAPAPASACPLELPRLKVLKMPVCPEACSEEVIAQLVGGCPMLSVVDVSHWPLSGEGMRRLAGMRQLKQVSVYTTQTSRDLDAAGRQSLMDAVKELKGLGLKTNPWKANHRRLHYF